MRKKILAVVLTVTMGLSMAVGVSAAQGGDGVNWEELDNLGANITIGIENESTQRAYQLDEFLEFYTDTYCDKKKGIQGTRTMEVKAYTGSDPAGVGLVEYKDDEGVWKDISGYNTKISFKNEVDRYFHIQFVKNGIYTIRSYFIASDKSMAVSSSMRYVIVDKGTMTITRVAPEPKQYYVEETTTVANTTIAPESKQHYVEETTTVADTTIAQKNVKPLGKVKVKSVVKKKSSKKATIQLKAPLKNANGYVVCFYKTKKEAKKNSTPFVKKIYKKNKVKFTVSHKLLKKQKKLFVRIRGYQVVDKKMILSKKWSATKKVKVGK